jgi:hypothetical protein
MHDNQQEGFYTRTGAFNFLKVLLNLPKNALVNKDFFSFFFIEYEGVFKIRKTEEETKEIFSRNNIADLNQQYYQAKKENNGKANHISLDIFARVRSAMSPEGQKIKEPYFVRQ